MYEPVTYLLEQFQRFGTLHRLIVWYWGRVWKSRICHESQNHALWFRTVWENGTCPSHDIYTIKRLRWWRECGKWHEMRWIYTCDLTSSVKCACAIAQNDENLNLTSFMCFLGINWINLTYIFLWHVYIGCFTAGPNENLEIYDKDSEFERVSSISRCKTRRRACPER